MKLAEYIKGQPLKFKEELTGQKSGENFLVLRAYDHDEVVGSVEYSTYRDDLSIKMIRTIRDADKRKGIATALAKELQRLYPTHEVIWGTTTGDGHKFLKTLPRTFIRNDKYDKLEGQLKALQAKQTKLQHIYDNWSDLFDKDKEKAVQLRPAIHRLNDTFNQVSDKIWETEQALHDLKPGHWQINEMFSDAPYPIPTSQDKKRGFIGVVDQGRIKGYDQMVPNVMQVDHSEIGPLWGERFRFFVATPKNSILWNEYPPSESAKHIVENWLAKKGFQVDRHLNYIKYSELVD
jgi:hypothetical protein